MKMRTGNESYESALRCLTPALRAEAQRLGARDRARAEELRFRVGQPVTVTLPSGSWYLSGGRLFPFGDLSGLPVLTPSDLDALFASLCRYSVHAFQEQLRSGYVTVRGGHRAGLCGTAVVSGGRVTSLRQISSVNLRIARDVPGASEEVLEGWSPADGGLLLVGPPGSGKTTVLRDLVRQLPPRVERITLIDERGELAGMTEEGPALDVGPAADVLTGFPKAEGILTALRAQSPQLIVCDELGGGEDAAAIRAGVNAGVTFAASVHGRNWKETACRPQVRALLETGGFSRAAVLDPSRRGRLIGWEALT